MDSIKKFTRVHGTWLVFVIFANILVIAEPLLHGSKAAMLDSNAHILTIAQFHNAMGDGEFPVMWGDGFANYGLPVGTISHQIPNYIGGMLTFVTNSPLISYYLLIFIALIASAMGFYIFLALFMSPSGAFLGTFLYTFATYRITNIYVRGAMPELFSTVWLPYIFITILYIKQYSRSKFYLIFAILLTLLILTHPMSLILYTPAIFVAALVFLRFDYMKWLGTIFSSILALAASSYYLLPLMLESKYLYMAANSNLLVYDQALTAKSFVSLFPRFTCVEMNYIFWRCADIRFGLLETIILTLFTVFLIAIIVVWRGNFLVKLSKDEEVSPDNKSEIRKNVFIISLVGLVISLFFGSILSQYFYESIPTLGNIQIPSRFLSVVYFFSSILFVYLYEISSHRKKIGLILWCSIISLVIVLQFPQIYGKNYTNIPMDSFYFSAENYHGLMVQPKWTLDSREYPISRQKGEIVKGRGEIVDRIIKNASRKYKVVADTDVTVNDHTFYFPGWTAYVDGASVPIEFQDPAYRGVITFGVPKGEHEAFVVYEDTKVRRFGKYVTLISIGVLVVYAAFVSIRAKKKRI